MTFNDTKKLMDLNFAMYKGSERELSKEHAATQLTVWAAVLKDVPFSAGQKAMLKAFRVCRFPVTLADLMAQLHAMQAEQDISGPECWAEITRAGRQAADNAAGYGWTLRMEDGRTQGQIMRDKNKRLFESLHPAARRWLGSLSELVNLGRMDSTELKYQRRDFEKAFISYQSERPLIPEVLEQAAQALPQGENRNAITTVHTLKE